MKAHEKTCQSIVGCQEGKHVLFQKKGYSITECIRCGHRFTKITETEEHLSKVYSDDYFFKGKDGYPNYLEEMKSLYQSGKYYSKIIRKYHSPGKVLDVGCAAGFILKGFEESGWNCSGVEPNDTLAAYGRQNLHLNITTGGLETYKSSEKFDLVNLIEVIGCFPDLEKAMLNVSNLLNDDGLVLVESWNMKSFVARVFGKNWHEYCPPSVIHWFSDRTLKELFHKFGMELMAKGRPSKHIKLKHALAIVNENMPMFIFKQPIFNFLSVTFGNLTLYYPPADLKWYIFKKTV